MARRPPRNRTQSMIDVSGPFFTRDPELTFRQNVRVLMAAIASEGAEDVRQQLRQGESGRAEISARTAFGSMGRVSHHIVGRVHNLRGRPWAVTAVVSVNNSRWTKQQGIALMAAASELEGRLHAFRKTTNRLRRGRAVNRAELLKGLK